MSNTDNIKSPRHTVRAAVFVLLMREGKTFLLRRQNTGWADGMLTVPSGHVDAGETAIEAAIKEVREEAGVVVKEEDLEFMHVQYVGDVYVNFYFKAEVWEGEKRTPGASQEVVDTFGSQNIKQPEQRLSGEPYVAEPDLASECLWAPLDALPSDLIFHIKAMLLESVQGEYFSCVVNDPNPTNQ